MTLDSINLNTQVDNCKLPGLAISLTLQHSRMRGVKQRGQGEPLNEVVAFVSGLLFGNDEEVRKWFAQYVKMSQKVSIRFFRSCVA